MHDGPTTTPEEEQKRCISTMEEVLRRGIERQTTTPEEGKQKADYNTGRWAEEAQAKLLEEIPRGRLTGQRQHRQSGNKHGKLPHRKMTKIKNISTLEEGQRRGIERPVTTRKESIIMANSNTGRRAKGGRITTLEEGQRRV